MPPESYFSETAPPDERRAFILEVVRVVQEANAIDFKTMRDDIAQIKTDVAESAHMARSTKRILVGETEYKRPGLVERVDFHDRLIMKWGGGFCACLAMWEIIKAVWFRS